MNKYNRKTSTENDVIQAARWFMSFHDNTIQGSPEYKRLLEAVIQYNLRNPTEPLVEEK